MLAGAWQCEIMDQGHPNSDLSKRAQVFDMSKLVRDGEAVFAKLSAGITLYRETRTSKELPQIPPARYELETSPLGDPTGV